MMSVIMETPTIRIQPLTKEQQFKPVLKQILLLIFINVPPNENQVANYYLAY